VRALVLRRLAHMVPILLGLSVISFALIHLTPGDPAVGLLAQKVTPQLIAQVRHELGLDIPLWQQYLLFIWNAIHGNLGYSYRLHEQVNVLVGNGLPVTAFLVIYACVIALALGGPLAVVAASYRTRWPDQLVRGTLVVTFSLPAFWVAVLLIGLALRSNGVLPSGGYGTNFFDHLGHLFLPSLTLSLTFLVVLVRSLRASLIEVAESDYVALARLKGIGRGRLLFQHILRNAISPAITILGLNMSYLLGATVVVESVFGINGLGNTLVAGVLARDYQLVQGITLVFGLLVILINLAVDFAQAAIDPSLRSAPR
jgi:ABC-type dipeptide/oligopeptide/nickel transport system permease component